MNENEEDLLHSNTLGGGKWTDSATRNAALNLESLLLTKIKINRNNKNNIHHIAPPGEESSPATSSPLVVEKGLEIERQADLDWVGAALAPRILTHRIAPMFKQQANVDQRLILNKSNSSSISSSSRSITADASYVTSVNLKAINIEGEVDDNPYQLRTISSSSSRPRVIDRREREKVDFADRPWKVQQVDTIPILYHLIFTLKVTDFISST